MPKVLNYRVIIEQDEGGYFVASAPSIPGCHTQGDTYEEAVANVKEAIELCLEVARDDARYRSRIDWDVADDEFKTRFLGVVDVPVRFNFAT